MKAKFDRSRSETDTITTFYFRPENKFEYTAGQYAEFSLPHDQSDKRGGKRWFTLSSCPGDQLLSFTTRLDSKSGSSFKRALSRLKPGQEINVTGPFGDFVLPKLVQTPLVFVALGMGITPFRSILEWLAATGEHRPVKLLYGVNSESDIIFQDTFAKAGIHATVVVSQPTDAWGGERGDISAELILGLEDPGDDALVYLSGPEGMVQTLSRQLTKAGLAGRQIVTDEFPGYQSL